MEHSRVHAEDCADCVNEPDQPAGALLRVAQKCPVHQTLLATPQIVDTIEVVA